jgi:ribosomal protein S6--L-glutamate ligase/tetrahydromethanopterin:alpha-L-glutamate ligase
MEKRGVEPFCFGFSRLVARVGFKPAAVVDDVNIVKDLNALIMRPVGRGSLEEIIFRMDFLHRLERLGLVIVNPPLAMERAVDKFHALAFLEENDVSVPRTVVTESVDEALEAFRELGGDVVVKPVFGSRGMGSTRISDVEVARRVFRALVFYHQVLYVQEFVRHGVSDIRAFVVGDHVIAAMRRVAEGWKTNVSLGAKPVSLKLDADLERLAVKASSVVGCKVAGVDILESESGPLVVELNSQPGWRGLQSVTDVSIAGVIVDFVLGELKG